VIHNKHACYLPTLIFGRLLIGSNLDNAEKKTTGGCNGYGVKPTNIFSVEFVVECLATKRGSHSDKSFRTTCT
jgi:DNA topoisomerase-2